MQPEAAQNLYVDGNPLTYSGELFVMDPFVSVGPVLGI